MFINKNENKKLYNKKMYYAWGGNMCENKFHPRRKEQIENLFFALLSLGFRFIDIEEAPCKLWINNQYDWLLAMEIIDMILPSWIYLWICIFAVYRYTE